MNWCPSLLPPLFVMLTRWSRLCLLSMTLPAACMASSSEPIYLIDPDADVIHLSNRPREPGGRFLVEPVSDTQRAAGLKFRSETARSSIRHSQRRVMAPVPESPLARIINAAAVANGIEPELLNAMISVESGYAVGAISSRGARGLMQLMPATALDYGVSDPFDPAQNIEAGARHLRRLLDRFGQDKTLALAAYNAGPEAVVRHRGQIPPYAETMAYVPRVLERFNALQRQSQSAPPGIHTAPLQPS